LGPKPCLTNPGVNILPLDGQLWMTIDNRFWGAIDMETLDTPAPLGIPALVEVYTVALNAHPACDYNGNGECLVTYPCAGTALLAWNKLSILTTYVSESWSLTPGNERWTCRYGSFHE